VTITVDADLPDKAVECNCSLCRNKGLVLAAVPRGALTVTGGEDKLGTYRFNRNVIAHRFCSACGSQPFSEGKGRDGSPMAMVNLRCVPEADIESMERIKFDGASL
jgi:hypothetical protein